VTVRTVFQMAVIGLVTLVIGLPAIALGLLVPGQSRKGRIFRWVTKSYSMILLPSSASPSKRAASPAWTGTPRTSSCRTTRATSTPSRSRYRSRTRSTGSSRRSSRRSRSSGGCSSPSGRSWWTGATRCSPEPRFSNAASALKGNNSVLIYVEGTRSKDGKLQPLKKGGFHIALHSGLPIVPVRVSGSHEIVPSGSLRVRPGHVVVELFDPIPTEGKTEADVPVLMARVRDALLS